MWRGGAIAVLAAVAVVCVPVAAAPAAPGERHAVPQRLAPSLAAIDGARARAGLRRVGPVEVPPPSASHDHAHRGIPDLGARPRIPESLRLSGGGGAAKRDHWAAQFRQQQFQDQHGHVLTLATDVEGLDLTPYAELLASTYHHGEVELLHLLVAGPETVSGLCGNEASACYSPDDPDSSGQGAAVVSHDDPGLMHVLFHEYGHHVDNQLYNLADLIGCTVDADGSRRWFFKRDRQGTLLDDTSCEDDAPWEQQLAELYAEDYAQLAGVPRTAFDGRLSLPPPTQSELEALRHDMDSPFLPRTRTLKGRFRGKRPRLHSLRLEAPAFVAFVRRSGLRNVALRRCAHPIYEDLFQNRCSVRVHPRRGRRGSHARYTLKLDIY